jgi:uncharacterized membrane protein
MSQDNLPLHQADPLTLTTTAALHPKSLRKMAWEGFLSAEAYEEALRYLGIRPDPIHWTWFWQRVLSYCGALFFVAGVICFFAYNWAEMHHFSKFALIGSLILVAGLVGIWRGLDSLPGKLGLLLASLCIGPLLAVYGQTYLTGANAWELFRVWTLAILPLALVGRQAALWLLVWLLGSTWGSLYLSNLSTSDFFLSRGWPEYLVAQSLCLAGWEIASKYFKNKAGHEWLQATWLPRIIGFAILSNLTQHLAVIIFGFSGRTDFGNYLYLPEASTGIALYVILMLGGWLWYRKKRPDLFMISGGVFSAAVLLACILLKQYMKESTAGCLIWGLIIAGLTAGCGLILLRIQRAMEAEGDDQSEAHRNAYTFSQEKRQKHISWEDLWGHLRNEKLITEDPPPLAPGSSAPWYISTLMALGGWVSALFFIGFLTSFVMVTLGKASRPEALLFFGGIIFLAAAWLLLKRRSIFTSQFALALALAGTATISGAIASWVGVTGNSAAKFGLASLLVSLVFATTFLFIKHSAYRVVATILGLQLFFWGLDALIWQTGTMRQEGIEGVLMTRHAMHTLWYAFMCVFFAWGWLSESKWRTDEQRNSIIAPLLQGVYCAVLISLAVYLLAGWTHTPAREFHVLGLMQSAIGIGAGIGLAFFTHAATRVLNSSALVRQLFFGIALLALACGWHLPGLTVGLLGLAIGRHIDSATTIGATACAMAAYFFFYYYNLDTTLLHKSITMIGSGSALALAGFWIYRLAKKEAAIAGGGHA